MARRKHAKTAKRHTRRRRIGAMGGNTLTTFAGTLGGYVVGNIVQSKLFPTMDAKIKGAVFAAAGVLLVPKLAKGCPLINGMGIGLAVSGGANILKSLGVISGYGGPSTLPSLYALPTMAGAGVNSMVNGSGVNSMVNGRGNQQISMVNGRESGVSSMVNGRMTTRRGALMTG